MLGFCVLLQQWIWGTDGLPSVRGRSNYAKRHIDPSKRQGESIGFMRASVPEAIEVPKPRKTPYKQQYAHCMGTQIMRL